MANTFDTFNSLGLTPFLYSKITSLPNTKSKRINNFVVTQCQVTQVKHHMFRQNGKTLPKLIQDYIIVMEARWNKACYDVGSSIISNLLNMVGGIIVVEESRVGDAWG